MKINGKIQIVGGTPGVDRLLTCIDSSGNAEWKTLTTPNDGDDIVSGQVTNNILTLTKESGNTVDINLTTLTADCGDCIGKYVDSINIVDDPDTVCKQTTVSVQEIVDSIETVVEVDPLTISKSVSDFTLTRFINECPSGYDVVYSSTTTGYFTESTGIGYNDWCPDGYTHDELGDYGKPNGSKCFKVVTNTTPTCPAGYTLVGSGANQICEKITTVPVIDNMDLSDPNNPVPKPGFVFEPITKGNSNAGYGANGGLFMDIDPSNSYPFVYSGGTVPQPFTSSSNNLWKERLHSSNDTGTNNVGIWGNYPNENVDDRIWLGFNHCIEIAESKTYVIGMAADNLCKLSVDGQLIIEFTAGNETRNFKHWWLFPVTLDAGKHIISMEGYDNAQVASFGAEIYDMDMATLKTYTTEAELVPTIIFSTKPKQNSSPPSYFDISNNPSHLRYACPSGFLLSECSNVLECVKIENASPGLTSIDVVDTNPEIEVKCRSINYECPPCPINDIVKTSTLTDAQCSEQQNAYENQIKEKEAQASQLQQQIDSIESQIESLSNNSSEMAESVEESNGQTTTSDGQTTTSAGEVLGASQNKGSTNTTPLNQGGVTEVSDATTSKDVADDSSPTISELTTQLNSLSPQLSDINEEILDLKNLLNTLIKECGGCTHTTTGEPSDVYLIGDPNYINPNPVQCVFEALNNLDTGCCKKIELTYNDGSTTHVNINELYSDNNDYSLTLNDNILTFSMSSSCNSHFEDVTVDLSSLGGNGAGADGVGVTSTVDNGNGTFTINYSDGTSFTSNDLTGPQGPKGDTGAAGTDGKDGTNGSNGIQGPKGDKGDTGAAGADGKNGSNGAQGIQGPKGDKGDTGAAGADGKNGAQGIQGPKGDTGAAGANGKDGINGNDGVGVTSTVDNGDGTFTINYSDGSTFTTSNLTGPQGPKGDTGADGKNGSNGAPGPKGDPGKDGVNGSNGTDGVDGVGITNTIDNGDGTFTINYSDGTSFTTSNLTGPQGPKGDSGNNGTPGNDGKNGTNGVDGVGVSSTVDNGDGTFTINYSDGTSFTTSDLTGPAGPAGSNGSGSDKFLVSGSLIETTIPSGGGVNSKTPSEEVTMLRLTMSDSTNIDVNVTDLVGSEGDSNSSSLWFDKPTGNNIYRHIGNVGIGLDSPQKRLHVKSDNAILRLETTENAGGNFIEFTDSAAVKGVVGYTTKTDALNIWNQESTNGSINLITTSGLGLTLQGQSVAIGGVAPLGNENLTVRGSSSISTGFGDTDPQLYLFNADTHSGGGYHSVDSTGYKIDLSYQTGANAPSGWTHKDINLSINDNIKLSIDGDNGKVSVTDDLYIGGTVQINGGNPGSGKVLTSDGSGNATWQTPTSSGSGSDSYITNVTLTSDLSNMNVLRFTRNNGLSDLSVSLNSLQHDPDATHNSRTTVTTTTKNETVTVTHNLNRFYPVFTVYHVNRGKVILPEAVGMVNSTGMIPANAVTGPHQLHQIDMTFAEPGIYIISFVA